MAWGCVFVFGKDALISNDGTDAFTDIAVVEAAVGVVRIEEEEVGVVREVTVLRRRPVVAVFANKVEVGRSQVAAGSWQENATTVGLTGELRAFHPIEYSPFISAVVKQLLYIIRGGHTPLATPLHMSHIVFSTADVYK